MRTVLLAALTGLLLLGCPAPDEDPAPEDTSEPDKGPGVIVRILPNKPQTTDTLKVTVKPAKSGYVYLWRRDGAPTDFKGDTVPAKATARGQSWRVTVGLGGAPVGSDHVKIVNTPPSPPEVTLTPASPAVDETVTCEHTAAEDADGDTLTYAFEWEVQGVGVVPDATGASSSPAALGAVKGDGILCRVTGADQAATSEPAASPVVVVANSAPAGGMVGLTPASAAEGDTLICLATGATDPDGDAVAWEYSWTVNSIPVAGAGGETDSLASEHFDRGDQVVCVAVPSDGTDAGEPVTSLVLVVANTLPTIDAATISPEQAGRLEAFECAYEGWADPDPADLEEVAWSWLLLTGEGDEQPIDGEEGSVLAAAALLPGDQVRCHVTPLNGAEAGAPMVSTAATVVNYPPTGPAPVVSPDAPTVTSSLECLPGTWSDADTDPIALTTSWTRDGVPIDGATEATLSGAFAKGDVIACSVIASDGFDEAPAVTSAGVTIQNTLPTVSSASVTVPEDGTGSFTCAFEGWSDPDPEDAEPSVLYSWWVVAGEAEPEPVDGQATAALAVALVAAGTEVFCRVTPVNGEALGPAVDSPTAAAPNSPPSIATVTLSPLSPNTLGVLTCLPEGTSDPEGDDVQLEYTWSVNGSVIEGQQENTLSGDHFVKEDTIQCTVTPLDASGAGASKTSDPVVVVNSLPWVTEVTLTPSQGTQCGVFTCIEGGAVDADEDDLTLSYRWELSGATIDATESSVQSVGAAGDLLQCFVTASDGEPGPEHSSNIASITANSAPALTGVALLESAAAVGTTLHCAPQGFSDDCADEPAYAYVWFAGGTPIAGETADTLVTPSLPPGTPVWCAVTPTDGEAEGDTIASEPVWIRLLADTDGDGVSDAFDDQDGEPAVCTDVDGDGCDDCTSGHFDPMNDGLDEDGDGICSATDPNDSDPANCLPAGEKSCPIAELKDPVLTSTLIGPDGSAGAAIVAPEALSAAAALIAYPIEAATGVTLPSAPVTSDPETLLAESHVIAIGDAATNPFIQALYRDWYTLVDARYPGPGGYVVRTIHDPYGTGHNVILVGAHDPEDVGVAAETLVGELALSGFFDVLWLNIIQLSPTTQLPEVGVDLGTNLAQEDWNVHTWQDSLRLPPEGSDEEWAGYVPGSYFGWNVISVAGMLYHMTGEPEYLNLFLDLARADPSDPPVPFLETVVYASGAEDPIVDVYHYRSHRLDLVWDLIEESPLLTDEDRLYITNRLRAHQYRDDTLHSYPDKYAVGPTRHGAYRLLCIYTGSRYFMRHYPDTGFSGDSWAERVDVARGVFQGYMDGDTSWGESDSLFWVSTSIEFVLEFFMLDNPEAFAATDGPKQLMQALEVLRTGDWKDDYNEFLPISLLHRAAGFTGDSRYLWMRNELGYDLDVFRIGPADWPTLSEPWSEPTDLVGVFTRVPLAESDWVKTTASQPDDAPLVPLDEAFQLVGYRDGVGADDDLILVDGHMGFNRHKYHLNAIYRLRMFGGLNLLSGHLSDLDVMVGGAAAPEVGNVAAIERSWSSDGRAYLRTRVPGMPSSTWWRDILYVKDVAAIVIDRVQAIDAGDFSATASWQMTHIPKPTGDNLHTTEAGIALSYSEVQPTVVEGTTLRQTIVRTLAAGEVMAAGAALSLAESPWEIRRIPGQTAAFVLQGGPTDARALVVIGALELPGLSVDAAFAWITESELFLDAPVTCTVDGVELVSDPDAPVLSMALGSELGIADKLAAISVVDAVLGPPSELQSDWAVDWTVSVGDSVDGLRLTTADSDTEGQLWVGRTTGGAGSVIKLSPDDGATIATGAGAPESQVESLWTASSETQATAFDVVVGFSDDWLRAYDAAGALQWEVKTQVDETFIAADGGYIGGDWFLNPDVVSGVSALLVGHVWGTEEELIVAGRPSTVEFHHLDGSLVSSDEDPALGRVEVRWGKVVSLAAHPQVTVPAAAGGPQPLVLAAKDPALNPYLSTITSAYKNLTGDGPWFQDAEFYILPEGYAKVATSTSQSIDQLHVRDLDGDGLPEIVYSVTGAWTEVRAFDGYDPTGVDATSGAAKWAQYFGPGTATDTTRGLSLVDLDGDELPEVVLAVNDGRVAAIKTTTGGPNPSEILWVSSVGCTISVSMAMSAEAGFAGSSSAKLTIGCEDGRLLTLDSNGNVINTAQLSATVTQLAGRQQHLFAGTADGMISRLRLASVIAAWRFDEVAGELAESAAGEGMAATLHGDPEWQPSGKVSGALTFDGLDDYAAAAPLALDDRVTLSVWVNLAAEPADGSTATVLAQGAGGLAVRITPERTVSVESGASDGPVTTHRTVPIGTWTHLGVRIGPMGTELSVDSEPAGYAPAKAEYTLASDAPVLIAASPQGAGTADHLAASLDELVVTDYTATLLQLADLGVASGAWAFDEVSGTTARDSTGGGADGALQGEGAWWHPGYGRHGGAVRLEGAGGHVKIPNVGGLKNSGAFTASMWAFVDALPLAGAHSSLLCTDGDGEATGLGYCLDLLPDGTLRLTWESGAGGTLETTSTEALELQRWTHLGITVGAGGAQLYIDGGRVEATSTEAAPASMSTSAADLFAGADLAGNNELAGRLDDLRTGRLELSSLAMAELFCQMGHWRLDGLGGEGVVLDSSPHGSHGEIVGPTLSSDSVDHGSLHFDGVDDYVRIPHTSALKMDKEVTVAYWLKLDAYQAKYWAIPVAKTKTIEGAFVGFYTTLEGGGSWKEGLFRVVSDAVDVNFYTPTPILIGEWAHVAITIAPEAIRYYLNGALVASGTPKAEYSLDNTKDLYLGSYGSDPVAHKAHFLPGYLDDIRLYSCALDADAIQSIYALWAN